MRVIAEVNRLFSIYNLFVFSKTGKDMRRVVSDDFLNNIGHTVNRLALDQQISQMYVRTKSDSLSKRKAM